LTARLLNNRCNNNKNLFKRPRGHFSSLKLYFALISGEVDWNLTHGPITEFCKLKEFDSPDLDGFNIRCGSIMYSKIAPLFSVVLGLTGTLPSPSFDAVLSPYKFVFRSELPSTFQKASASKGTFFEHVPMVLRSATGGAAKEALFERIANHRKLHKNAAIIVILKDSKTIKE